MIEISSPVVCVDVMGGDKAPSVLTEGIRLALAADDSVRVLAVGTADLVEALSADQPRVEPVATSEIIAMDEHPVAAIRSKKDSSIVVGCRLVKEGRAHAFFSAGNTGACMAAATLTLGRIPGVVRPAIAAVIPTNTSPVVLLDAGANADCRAEHLLQFAHMGSAYSRIVLGTNSPRVALLNIGEEESKGSLLTQEAYVMMKEGAPGFIGNVEGTQLASGAADVIVTDGFTGNVALKLMEGVSSSLMRQVRDVVRSTALTRLGAMPMRDGFAAIVKHLDPETYGGAPLLGVDGVCIIGHGSSSAVAVQNAIAVAAEAVRGRLTASIQDTLHAT